MGFGPDFLDHLLLLYKEGKKSIIRTLYLLLRQAVIFVLVSAFYLYVGHFLLSSPTYFGQLKTSTFV